MQLKFEFPIDLENDPNFFRWDFLVSQLCEERALKLFYWNCDKIPEHVEIDKSSSNYYTTQIWFLNFYNTDDLDRLFRSKDYNEKYDEFTVYSPDDKVRFGKYKGEDWRFVYMFDPEYIEFLLRKKDWFVIDYLEFNKLLSSPLPKSLIGWDGYVNIDNELIRAVDYVKNYLSSYKAYLDPPLNPKPHDFSENYLKLIYQKLLSVRLTELQEEYIAEVEREALGDAYEEPFYEWTDPASYCGACEQDPCMCSDREETSMTLGW